MQVTPVGAGEMPPPAAARPLGPAPLVTAPPISAAPVEFSPAYAPTVVAPTVMYPAYGYTAAPAYAYARPYYGYAPISFSLGYVYSRHRH